jgi:hypothetical protein
MASKSGKEQPNWVAQELRDAENLMIPEKTHGAGP